MVGEQNFSLLKHGYAERVDICNSTFMNFAYVWCPFHKRVRKCAVISNKYSLLSEILCSRLAVRDHPRGDFSGF